MWHVMKLAGDVCRRNVSRHFVDAKCFWEMERSLDKLIDEEELAAAKCRRSCSLVSSA